MSFWELESIRGIVGGTWLARPEGTATDARGLSTDTRTLKPGELFLAIRGETHDGHRYLAQAAGAGASMAIVERADESPRPKGLAVLGVADTRRALLRLAGAYRRTLERTRVVAVTGSNGKTTTVRMIEAVLSRALRGTASRKSFNNQIGVPLTILSARPGDDYLVCEIGTNAPGEVAQLAEIVAPDIAVITSVGREHLEGLGSLAQVAREEAAQVEFLEPGGLAVVNADAPHLAEPVAAHRAARPFSVVTFGAGEGADLRVGDIRQTLEGLEFTINGRASFRLPLLGRHNAMNAAAAVAVGRRLGMDEEAIAPGLSSVSGAEMRLERTEVKGVRLLNDAYNANPDSMLAALETLQEVGAPAARRVAVLGDMLELGTHSASCHAEVVSRALAPGLLDLLVLVGPRMSHGADGVRDDRIVRVEDLDGVGASAVAARLRAGDLVLVKGSRRMRLERLVGALASGDAGPTTV